MSFEPVANFIVANYDEYKDRSTFAPAITLLTSLREAAGCVAAGTYCRCVLPASFGGRRAHRCATQ